ncbi:DUF7511 domain-containing protein [Natrinema sp. CGMCC1.2065]|uniref:DUF7511 domain-containing protein n=1 Tax=Natrinema sp. CGMCC1.2065 TaxID=3445767 RepID=UPI003F49CA40
MATTLAEITMDGATDGTDGGTGNEDATNDRAGPADAALFEAVVVRYESECDRCTLVPRDGSTEAKLNAWLAADLETVVDLDDAR